MCVTDVHVRACVRAGRRAHRSVQFFVAALKSMPRLDANPSMLLKKSFILVSPAEEEEEEAEEEDSGTACPRDKRARAPAHSSGTGGRARGRLAREVQSEQPTRARWCALSRPSALAACVAAGGLRARVALR